MSAARANTRPAEVRQRGGDAGQRRAARPGVAAARRRRPRSPRSSDWSRPTETATVGKRVAQEGDVAQQERAAVQDEEAFVHAGAAATPAGEKHADLHLGMRVERHGEWRQALRRAASAAARTRPSGRSYRPRRRGSGRVRRGRTRVPPRRRLRPSARRTAEVRAVTATRRSTCGRRHRPSAQPRGVQRLAKGALHRRQQVEGDAHGEAQALDPGALEKTRPTRPGRHGPPGRARRA